MTDHVRRNLFKVLCIGLAASPTIGIPLPAIAAINPELRAKLKYQTMPQGDQSCQNCVAFQSGTTDKDFGKCSLIPGDDEISPNGYCIGWYTM